ncbi:GTPase HflX [Paenibacillus flagellatus]|uniref:GTPase HflX n=1 Tax=Paenibacillus flagellatus TaxID=2211139 RepID=A0A2V5KCM0_9BACL|nr:GTPase HflX [Paenibacillus flagellatus]PYI55914.1 GTPase HflX [Paenibacillus flagellatus]
MKQTIHEVTSGTPDKAVVVSLVIKSDRLSDEMVHYSLNELISLAESAGVEVLDSIVQAKDSVDSKWFIGKGKVEELRELAHRLGANTAIFDQELSGAQVRNLEQALDLKIIDRTQLILDIFAQRAKTREGFLQVELAQLSYLLPRLSGHGVNLSRLGGGIGTRGPGETKLETDRRHIRNRINELRHALQEVKRHRVLHRERRKKTGVFQVALVGYTNAGKSTLLNRLTQADVYAENQLFATLDPTSRTLRLPNGQDVVLTDTVGFIQNLPHDLVAAFRATLEEANEADLILHVVDSSSEMRERQMQVVDEVLQELGAQGKPRITVFNKIDLLPDGRSEPLAAEGDSIRISAFSETDLEAVKLAVQEKLMGDTKSFRIPAGRGDLISLLYRVGDVLDQEVEGEDIRFDVRVKQAEFDKQGHMLQAFMAHEAMQQEGESL